MPTKAKPKPKTSPAPVPAPTPEPKPFDPPWPDEPPYVVTFGNDEVARQPYGDYCVRERLIRDQVVAHEARLKAMPKPRGERDTAIWHDGELLFLIRGGECSHYELEILDLADGACFRHASTVNDWFSGLEAPAKPKPKPGPDDSPALARIATAKQIFEALQAGLHRLSREEFVKVIQEPVEW